ncbi:bifunctional adenosylcobinamide kinase/adenosylcobinamide-phosphate guanylyltransferase [Tropicimonas sp. S265A]|uniref:bifunctional adenosylcobinamide kinase/adenosylcobinamide-phosphate guanylyltransferase n=1 Tax=Tropicimonas sp. S265A TaxID=3415134 RepID=UPI003C7A824D
MPHLTVILGGAASGKSRFAEALVTETDRDRVYIATAQAFDAEMAAKIKKHKSDRGSLWRTLESPLDPAAALASVRETEIVLLDCATLWLSNVMLAEKDWEAEADAFLTTLAACPVPVVVVSNETGMGIVPEHRLGRDFRNAQGALNQRLAAQADRVALIVAGLPLALKGAF